MPCTGLHKGERIGRNPKTGAEAVIDARRVVKFTASILLKDRINKPAGVADER